jgi:hypothetical protein
LCREYDLSKAVTAGEIEVWREKNGSVERVTLAGKQIVQ